MDTHIDAKSWLVNLAAQITGFFALLLVTPVSILSRSNDTNAMSHPKLEALTAQNSRLTGGAPDYSCWAI